MTRRPLSALVASSLLLPSLAALVASAPPAAAGDLPPGFVRLADVDATIRQDMRYAGPFNFLGRKVAGYGAPACILTREAAAALKRAQAKLVAQGFSLKVYDCYRPAAAVADFARWARDPDTATKAEYYPAEEKAQLFRRGYIASRSGHSRGSTVDLTIVPKDKPAAAPAGFAGPCTAPPAERRADESVDMGTAFDCFDDRASTRHPAIVGEPARHRRILLDAMREAGFVNYAREWWHFGLANEPFPKTYFDFPVR